MELTDIERLAKLDEHVVTAVFNDRVRLGLIKIILIEEFNPPQSYAFFYDFVDLSESANNGPAGVLKEIALVQKDWGTWREAEANAPEFAKWLVEILPQEQNILMLFRAYSAMTRQWDGELPQALQVEADEYFKRHAENILLWPASVVMRFVAWSSEEESTSQKEVLARKAMAQKISDAMNGEQE